MTTLNATQHAPAMQPFSNTPILARVARGDRDAFELMLRQYRPLLTYLIRRSLGSSPSMRATFDDAMQEVCLAIWTAARHYNPSLGSEKTFISTVARRRLVDCIHRTARRRIRPQHLEDVGEPGTGHHHGSERELSTREQADCALAAIDPENRHLVTLALVEGKSSTEIARATGLRVNTIKTRIHRTVRRLRSSPELLRAVA